MKRYFILIILIIFSANTYSQKKKKQKENPSDNYVLFNKDVDILEIYDISGKLVYKI